MRINFDFLDLEVFLAVKETGSFHRASERLNLSQPSVTRRIKALETALGTPLFDRTTRAVRPTLAAKRLQIRAEAMLDDAREATRALRDDTEAHAWQRARTVTVATIPTVVRALLVPALRAFRDAGHRARLRLLDLAANEVAEAVAGGEADLGLCSLPHLEPGTVFEPLFHEPLVLAMPAHHPLAAHPRLTWADLEAATLILPARGTGNRLLIDEAMARGARSLRWHMEVSRSSTALDLVAEGVGVAPLPLSCLAQSGDGPCWRSIEAPLVSRPIGLLTRLTDDGSRKDTAPVAALCAALRAVPPPGLQ